MPNRPLRCWSRPLAASEAMLMIRPPPRCAIRPATAKCVLRLPVRLIAMTLSQNAGSVARNGCGLSQPALLTRTHTGPRSASTAATAASTPAKSLTSTCQVLTVASPASAAVSSPAAVLRSKIVTLQASSARRSTNALPMPCPPPVTIATLPAKPFTWSSLDVARGQASMS